MTDKPLAIDRANSIAGQWGTGFDLTPSGDGSYRTVECLSPRVRDELEAALSNAGFETGWEQGRGRMRGFGWLSVHPPIGEVTTTYTVVVTVTATIDGSHPTPNHLIERLVIRALANVGLQADAEVTDAAPLA